MAKRIYYAWGTADKVRLDLLIARTSHAEIAVAVHTDALLTALINATERYGASLSKEPSREQFVAQRAEHMFSTMPKDLFDDA